MFSVNSELSSLPALETVVFDNPEYYQEYTGAWEEKKALSEAAFAAQGHAPPATTGRT